jgi:DNA-binding response OmpR family regulator
MLQKLLRPVSGGLEVAETAESALAMALNRRFDLVVSDVHMGEMDGVELFHRVQAANGGEGPYFILMTGDSSDPRVRRLAGQPRIEIMEKPFSMKRMLERVTALGWRNRQEYLDLCA